MTSVAAPSQVAVYGASGYTGRQIARELDRRGVRQVLVGRSAERLRAVARGLRESDFHVAALEDGAALRSGFAGSAIVVNAAGPFQTTCEPIVAAALDAGAHYVDFVAAEQAPLISLVERWDAPARDAGVALAPAMGSFGALGDVLAALVTRDLESVDEVTVAYAVDGWRPTAGSREAAVVAAAQRFAWRDRALQPVVGDTRFSVFEYPEPRAKRPVLEDYPGPEAVTVPRHIDVPKVRLLMTTSTLEQAFWGDPDTDGGPPDHSGSTFALVVVATSGEQTRRAAVTGSDIYGITAPIVAEAVTRLASAPAAGALAPSELLGVDQFLRALEPHGLTLTVAADVTPQRARASNL
jgi:short subunit dehydrogenase-like uncharacterized protein